MKLKMISFSIFGLTSLIATPLSTISCKKQILLKDAVKIKDLGYLTNLTQFEVTNKLFSLNSNLKNIEGLEAGIKHDEANFFIHPRYRKNSKYKGWLNVKFSSYIRPLFEENEISLTSEYQEHQINFEITRDFSDGKQFRYSSDLEKPVEIFEEKIEDIPNSELRQLIIKFRLKPGINKLERTHFTFNVEDAYLPEIIFNIK